MSLGKSSLPPPVINIEKPKNISQPSRPTNLTRWMIFKQMFKTSNTRYTFLWLTAGFIFVFYGKRVIAKREEELMVEDLDSYLKNKQK